MDLAQIIGNLVLVLMGGCVGYILAVIIKENLFRRVDDWFSAVIVWGPIGFLIGAIATWWYLGLSLSITLS